MDTSSTSPNPPPNPLPTAPSPPFRAVNTHDNTDERNGSAAKQSPLTPSRTPTEENSSLLEVDSQSSVLTGKRSSSVPREEPTPKKPKLTAGSSVGNACLDYERVEETRCPERLSNNEAINPAGPLAEKTCLNCELLGEETCLIERISDVDEQISPQRLFFVPPEESSSRQSGLPADSPVGACMNCDLLDEETLFIAQVCDSDEQFTPQRLFFVPHELVDEEGYLARLCAQNEQLNPQC